MRISERKKQLRERTGSATAHLDSPGRAERAVKRDRAARTAPTRRPGRASTRQAPTVRPARPARQRSPRFYYGFGLVGIVLSVILAESTVANYNKAVSDFPGKLAAYHTAMKAYQVALAKYHAAHGHGVSLPKHPTMPVHPTLSILDFVLPILYGALSIAYIYLGYRSTRGQRATGSPSGGSRTSP